MSSRRNSRKNSQEAPVRTERLCSRQKSEEKENSRTRDSVGVLRKKSSDASIRSERKTSLESRRSPVKAKSKSPPVEAASPRAKKSSPLRKRSPSPPPARENPTPEPQVTEDKKSPVPQARDASPAEPRPVRDERSPSPRPAQAEESPEAPKPDEFQNTVHVEIVDGREVTSGEDTEPERPPSPAPQQRSESGELRRKAAGSGLLDKLTFLKSADDTKEAKSDGVPSPDVHVNEDDRPFEGNNRRRSRTSQDSPAREQSPPVFRRQPSFKSSRLAKAFEKFESRSQESDSVHRAREKFEHLAHDEPAPAHESRPIDTRASPEKSVLVMRAHIEMDRTPAELAQTWPARKHSMSPQRELRGSATRTQVSPQKETTRRDSEEKDRPGSPHAADEPEYQEDSYTDVKQALQQGKFPYKRMVSSSSIASEGSISVEEARKLNRADSLRSLEHVSREPSPMKQVPPQEPGAAGAGGRGARVGTASFRNVTRLSNLRYNPDSEFMDELFPKGGDDRKSAPEKTETMPEKTATPKRDEPSEKPSTRRTTRTDDTPKSQPKEEAQQRIPSPVEKSRTEEPSGQPEEPLEEDQKPQEEDEKPRPVNQADWPLEEIDDLALLESMPARDGTARRPSRTSEPAEDELRQRRGSRSSRRGSRSEPPAPPPIVQEPDEVDRAGAEMSRLKMEYSSRLFHSSDPLDRPKIEELPPGAGDQNEDSEEEDSDYEEDLVKEDGVPPRDRSPEVPRTEQRQEPPTELPEQQVDSEDELPEPDAALEEELQKQRSPSPEKTKRPDAERTAKQETQIPRPSQFRVDRDRDFKPKASAEPLKSKVDKFEKLCRVEEPAWLKRSSAPRGKVPTSGSGQITSSYGVGPTDDSGIPLFGLRALRKQKAEQPPEDKDEDEPRLPLFGGLRALKARNKTGGSTELSVPDDDDRAGSDVEEIEAKAREQERLLSATDDDSPIADVRPVETEDRKLTSILKKPRPADVTSTSTVTSLLDDVTDDVLQDVSGASEDEEDQEMETEEPELGESEEEEEEQEEQEVEERDLTGRSMALTEDRFR
ncbi:hypothetical protein FJT64_009780 [Amphibalanus amphitrite]|uniref:Uncharacterized protein n=1 Tax=Amphibalanus amphitrite TaxID=1232801 RepID=A0A6A4VLJ8_AMPAM|nr:hypothetical protein FJT64_009780 [Amphibalanus amphitrite]